MTTPMESVAQSHTSRLESVRMEVEPNSVVQTSPDRLEDLPKRLSSR